MIAWTRRGALAALGAAGLAPALGAPVASAAPPASGVLSVFEAFPSAHVEPRTVWVWIPSGVDPGVRMPVVYMQDGQNLFDEDLAAFGEWGVDETITAMIEAGETGGVGIAVVGIANSPLRRREYLPESLVARIAGPVRSQIEEAVGGPALSGPYLRFLTEEVKPFVEQRFPVQRRRQGAFLMGSSMGGLISLEALITKPDSFAGAACLSTHWPLRFSAFETADEVVAWQEALLPAIADYVSAAPPPGGARLWFDHGDQNLDRWYRPYQRAADAAFLGRGYRPGSDFASRIYPQADHNEASWRARLFDPLRFLFQVVR